MITLNTYLIISGIVFVLGLLTIINKKNAVGILMGVELILNAVNLNFVAFGRYVDSDIKGSASIKAVLPVMVPELSYKNLAVQEGQTAQRVWMETILREKHNENKAQIIDDLLEYCKLDTLAMVEIYKNLQE